MHLLVCNTLCAGYMERTKLKIHVFIYLHISETISSRTASDLEWAMGGDRCKSMRLVPD